MRRPARHPARLAAITAAPLLAIALSACTGIGPVPGLPSTSATPSPTASPRLSAAAIARLARQSVGAGTVVAVDDEADGTEWQVTVVLADGSAQQVHLGRDGAVLAGPSAITADADDRSDERARVAAADVSLATAQRRMLAAVPGGRVTGIELDRDDDGVVWQGDVLDAAGRRHDVRIDAVDGAIASDVKDAAPTDPPTGGS